ncbi:MAG TPA: hypothetical protein VKG84_15335 [Candidatus Acidoferrales bacterium]|nr:hypothetical protein [Candidatus Acidoferrales bacterium]
MGMQRMGMGSMGMGSRILRVLMLAGLSAALAALAAPARAQSRVTPFDAGHSYASFWMGGSSEVSVPVNVAVAQAGGTMALDAKKPAASSLDFSLVPGGEGAELLLPDGSVRENQLARILRYTVLGFRCTHTHVRRDGRVEFSGELTVTHVTREQILAAWNSTPGFPSYTDPVITRATRTVSFVLTSPHAEFLAAHLQKQETLLASATIDAGAFPELSEALVGSYWPVVAQDEKCQLSADSAGRRDYSGAVCTGKTISTVNTPRAAPSFGRDYAGRPRIQANVNGPITILLYLRLAAPADEKSDK